MENDFITIKIERNRFRKIFIDDILYCKADRIYSTIKTIDDKHLYSKPLKELESLLDDEIFVRINRSYIVNIKKCIELKTGNSVELILCNEIVLKPTQKAVLIIKEKFGITDSEVET